MGEPFKPTMSGLARVEVYGVPEMLGLLKTVNPQLRKATIARMKLAAKPLIADARKLMPDNPPISPGGQPGGGWKVSGRLGYDAKTVRKSISVVFKGTRIRDKNADTFPLLKLVMKSAGGSVYDMAGRTSSGRTKSGVALIAKLRKDKGGASRVMWTTVEAGIRDVEQGVKDAISDMEDAINARANSKAGI